MPTTLSQTNPRPSPARPLRHRARFPTLRPPQPKRIIACDATHDFLVPNPRPDLTFDPATLQMLTVS